MNFDQAIAILTQVTRKLQADADTHEAIKAALLCLKNLVPNPLPPKPPQDR